MNTQLSHAQQLEQFVTQKNESALKLFLKNTPNIETSNLTPALIKAIQQKNKNLTALLIEHGADVLDETENNASPYQTAKQTNDNAFVEFVQATALINAIFLNNEQTVQKLLEDFANIDFQDATGSTPLMVAAYVANPEVINLILAHNPNINLCTADGYNALFCCITNPQIVEMLINKGININQQAKEGLTPLLLASQSKATQTVNLLLKNNANINDCLENGNNALMIAIKKNDIETAKMLINAGISLSHKNNQEKTAFMLANETGNQEIKKAIQQKLSETENHILIDEQEMSVHDQIEFYVNNKMSFMLHGPSGVGKSMRVEEVDPDLTSISLYNGVLPEDIVGKTIYPNNNEHQGIWVAPDWYTTLKEKCEKEPHKIHVLFIDEVTNAKPTTQSLIFHIVLQRAIAVGKGKLPENSVVVLAGNNQTESSASYNMPEPLFRRLNAHIYLKPDLGEWLIWGSQKSKKHPENSNRLNIHPLVSSFVTIHQKDIFYTLYDEEKTEPQHALDPRGWMQVSNIIYNNNGILRKDLLKNKMGEELAIAFMQYAKNPLLTKEQILEGRFTENDIPKEADTQLALTLSLRYANFREVSTIRSFVKEKLGAENLAVFDKHWANDNYEKLAFLNQLRQNRTR